MARYRTFFLTTAAVLTAGLLQSHNTIAQEDWSFYLARANNSPEHCMEFLELMTRHKDDNPTSSGYYALAVMMQAKLYGNPFTKLSYFNQGKKILEASILKDPQNVELRFLRFAVQTEIPSILLYFTEIDEDQSILDEYLKSNNDALCSRIQAYYKLKGLKAET